MTTRPADCPDGSGNGHGCESLEAWVQANVEAHRNFGERIHYVESRTAQQNVTIDATKDAVERVEREQAKQAGVLESIRVAVCEPANALLARYQSDHSELMPADEGDTPLPTSVAIHIPQQAEKKIKAEQQRAIEAEKAVALLEAENRRIALTNQLALARIKLQATAIGAAVALAGIVAGVLTNWLR